MKKRRISKKLTLRKDTVKTLGQDAMGNVQGGTAAGICGPTFTNDAFCVATSLARGCDHHPSVGCTDTQGNTDTCNIECTNTCTLGCPTIGGDRDQPTGCNC